MNKLDIIDIGNFRKILLRIGEIYFSLWDRFVIDICKKGFEY